MSEDYPEGEGSEVNSLPSVVSGSIDGIWDLITGIPAPIRKNAIKAFARLCTTALEYPIAVIRGKIAEKQAESQARVRLIKNSATQIAKQMQITPAYAQAAATKFAHKIIRERVNIDQIALIAAEQLDAGPEPVGNESEEPEAPSISDDWLNAFESEAAQMSTEQMKRLFGKILAGEIRRPQSYSIKTLRLVAQVDNHAAALFSRLCSLSVSLRNVRRDPLLASLCFPCGIPNHIFDARVVSMGNPAEDSLVAYGLEFADLNLLQEYGLIIADYNSHMDYRRSVKHKYRLISPLPPLPVTYQNVRWVFVAKDDSLIPFQEFRVSGVTFSNAGKELLPIVDIIPDERYTVALKAFFAQQGMILTLSDITSAPRLSTR